MIPRRSSLPYFVAIALVAIAITIFTWTGFRRRNTALPRKAATRQQVASWIRKNAIPLRTVQAESGFEDMRPLRSTIGSARLVALGEATHGTKEFFQLKHRMFEFLVEEMGFTVFGIEANWPESLAINDYVVDGTGDPADALAGLHFWTWNTEEVLAMIRWMRRYNERPGHKRKVKFYGFDMQFPWAAAAGAIRYLETVDADYARASAAALAALGRNGDFLDENALAQACRAVQETAAELEQRILVERNAYVRRSSERDWLLARRHAQILREAVEVHLAFQQGTPGLRDRFMAENIQWIDGDEGPGTRMMIWAQNAHVSRVGNMMGRSLKALFPRDFVNFGFAFGEGSFQAKDGTPGAGQSRRLESFSVGPPSPDSLDGVLASTGLPLFVLDLRRADGAVADWFRSGHETREIGAIFPGESAMPIRVVPADRYDMLVFVDRTSRAEPVRNEPAASRPRTQVR